MRRKLVARLVAVVGLTALTGVLLTGQANAVANGQPAAPGTYPFAAELTATNIPNPDGTHRNSACSGALIAPQWIITAGHCFHDINRVPVSGPPQYQVTVHLGTVNLTDSAGEVRTVVDVRQSPVNDIALGKLDSPVTDIAPLVVKPTAPKMDENLEIAGWGATSDVNPTPGTVLNTGQVAVGSIADTTIGVHGVFPSSFTSACLYDSGAPYFQPVGTKFGYLVSVESDGPDCPHDQLETTSRADIIFKWIYQQVVAG